MMKSADITGGLQMKYMHTEVLLIAENKQSGVQNEHPIGFCFAMCRFLLKVFTTLHYLTPSLHLLEQT